MPWPCWRPLSVTKRRFNNQFRIKPAYPMLWNLPPALIWCVSNACPCASAAALIVLVQTRDWYYVEWFAFCGFIQIRASFVLELTCGCERSKSLIISILILPLVPWDRFRRAWIMIVLGVPKPTVHNHGFLLFSAIFLVFKVMCVVVAITPGQAW
jgi:hypothetical protein